MHNDGQFLNQYSIAKKLYFNNLSIIGAQVILLDQDLFKIFLSKDSNKIFINSY